MSVDNTTFEISDAAALPETPLVSVYMLAYRHERLIAEAIKGVIAQQCDFPIELIIGEDCSPDRTRTIALEYQRAHPKLIRVVTSNINVGTHANAARCRAACRGNYIAICEGDDYWHHPGKLQLQVEAMSASENVTLCHTDFDRKIGSRLKRNLHATSRPLHLAEGDAYESLLHAWTVMTATALYRADIVTEFGKSPFYNRNWPFGDYNLALFAATRGQVKYLAASTATWRKVAGSATNNSVEQYLAMALGYAECRELYLSAHPISKDTAHRVRTLSHISIMKRAFVAGRLDVFESAASWLNMHAEIPNKDVTRLQRFVLHHRRLMRTFQMARKYYFGLTLMGG